MTVLHISQSHELASIGQQSDPFVCLLRDDCHCDASHFQNTHCMALAIAGRRVSAMRRGKHFVECELSRNYACPVRLFKDEKSAQKWLTKKLQVAVLS